MHIRTYFSSCKTFLKILICFFLVYTPFFANAGAAEKWDLVENHYDDVGKNMSYMAKKMNSIPANDYTYKAKVPVNAATLGSSVAMLIRGGLAGAAIIGLIEGVGWIIENGVVKKKEPDGSLPQYMWCFANKPFSSDNCFLTPELAKAAFMKKYPDRTVLMWDKLAINHWYLVLSDRNNTSILSTKNPNFDENKEPNYIQVSDTEIGEKILDSPAAPKIIPDVYNPNQPTNTPAREASKEALDKALPNTDPATGESTPKPNTDTDGDGKPDTYDPTAPYAGSEFKFPPFCEIAPVMCVWYEKYSEDSKKTDVHRGEQKSFWEKVEDWFHWTKEDTSQLPEEEPTEIKDPDLDVSVTSYINFGSACPADRQIPFSAGGKTLNMVISYQPLCTVAKQFRPAVILMAFLAGAFIITNTGRRAETGD